MRKKLLLLLLIVAMGTATVSCFKKEKKNDNKQQTETTTNNTGTINTDIFNSNGQATGNPNITNLTPEEQQFLISNKIDPLKVSEAITKAENGDKESILSLAQLYFNLKDNEKTKKFLQMGVDKNYPEAIYNLAVLLKQEGNEAEANKLIARLPKGASTTSRQLRPGAQSYNNGIDLIKAKKYEQAKVQFQNAYKQGIKEADIKIALLNKETKNYDEAIKWFKLALARGVKEANFEIGAILYDTGRQNEARPYLLKSYNSGNKALAMPIAISYHKENNMSEAVKWYKIAAKNGDKDAKATVEQIEKGTAEANSSKPSSILNGNSKMTSLTDTTIAQIKESNSKSSDSSEASKFKFPAKTEENKNSSSDTKDNTGAVQTEKTEDNKSSETENSNKETEQSKTDINTQKAIEDAVKRAKKIKEK